MIVRCTDAEDIERIVNHSEVYKWVAEDCSPKPYEAVMHSSLIYLTDETKAGIIRLDPLSEVCCRAHIALLPDMWGEGRNFVKEAMKWGVVNTRYVKVVAIIPVFNIRTIKLVENCGFKKEGLITKSFLKDWELHDQILYGITKNEINGGAEWQ